MGDPSSAPTLSDCRFPVLAFGQTLVEVYDSPEALCVGNRRSLKRGAWFDGMRIVDAAAGDVRALAEALRDPAEA